MPGKFRTSKLAGEPHIPMFKGDGLFYFAPNTINYTNYGLEVNSLGKYHHKK